MMRRRIFFSGVLLLVAFVSPFRGQDKSPRIGDEKILMKTVAGDIVLGLYPDVAPKHVEQLLRLVKAGVYDTTHFYRVHPQFVAQLGNAEDRLVPLSSEQTALIKNIPAEFSSTLKHEPGTLSMAHDEGRPDSARTSFSVILGPASHLDGRYTIFGRVLVGEHVFEEFVRVPRDRNMKPRIRLTVESAEVIAPGIKLRDLLLQEARPVDEASLLLDSRPETGFTEDTTFFVYGFSTLTIILFVVFLFAKKGWASLVVAMSLLGVLIGTFYVLILMTPLGQAYSWLGALLFVILIGVLKLMGRFEEAKK